jgi:hypothetical protein
MAGLGQTEYTGVAQEARMTLSPRRRLSILAAPLFGGVSLVLAQAHAFGTGDRADAMLGAVVGVGIGISLTAMVRGKTCPPRAGAAD